MTISSKASCSWPSAPMHRHGGWVGEGGLDRLSQGTAGRTARPAYLADGAAQLGRDGSAGVGAAVEPGVGHRAARRDARGFRRGHRTCADAAQLSGAPDLPRARGAAGLRRTVDEQQAGRAGARGRRGLRSRAGPGRATACAAGGQFRQPARSSGGVACDAAVAWVYARADDAAAGLARRLAAALRSRRRR